MKKTLIAAAVMAASGVASDSKNVIDMQSGFLNGSRWENLN